MNRKLTSLAGVIFTVFSFAFSTQVADAQYFAGERYRELPTSTNDNFSGNYGYGYGQLVSYNNMQMSNPGYSTASPYGVGIGTGCSTCANYPAWGSSPYYGTSGCGVSACRPHCGLFGLFAPQPFPRLYDHSFNGCGVGCSGYGTCGGCSTCAPRVYASSCGFARRSCYSCRLSCGYTGAVAACCAPAQSTCCGVSGGVVTQPGTMTPTVIAPPAALSPAPTPTPAPAPTPTAPPAETPAAPPTPGT